MNKVDFIMTFTVKNANCNGDPLAENRPRVDSNGLGEISDVCLKRKIRNRLQDNGNAIFVQSKERTDDGCTSLQKRYEKYFDEIIKTNKENKELKIFDEDEKVKKRSDISDKKLEEMFVKEWLDVRAFGQVITYDKRSIGIRGPISIGIAKSLDPITIEDMQITKSVNGMEQKKPDDKASDTMGMKHFVEFGTYMVQGAVNAYFAEKTGFSEDDLKVFKEALKTIFVNDASSARPDGSMEVKEIFWFEHSCPAGDVSSAKIKSLIKWDKDKEHNCYEDYKICIDKEKMEEYEKLGLRLTVIEGL